VSTNVKCNILEKIFSLKWQIFQHQKLFLNHSMYIVSSIIDMKTSLENNKIVDFKFYLNCGWEKYNTVYFIGH